MPCVHAVAIIESRRLNHLLYFSPYFSISTYKQAYSGCIYPVLGDSDWSENDEEIYPPNKPRAPGRPRVLRIKVQMREELQVNK
ncbi:hypothetical protein AQUCO_06500003v1 [Aquilegia coerulea]|uniref:Zinc finger PMZ-type domain-containing protein n=1 Tax=Aquilegia coerulea TaxID=218851 RepID=A0A2G5CC84_AQUCA|nr:hypothetical protein AQUCO_06500003v1 [Aquilegia coerulea]